MTDSAGPAPYSIRPVNRAEFDEFDLVMQQAFHGSPASPESEAIRAGIFEFPRTLAAFDESSIVGTASAYSFSMTVPGGAVPCAGVTWVSVLPSHRRRGVLRSLMRRQLADVDAAGREPIAALWASEAGIYERYGYGRASWHLSLTVHRGEGVLARDGASRADGVRVRLVAPSSAREALASVYDQVRASRPGFFARNTAWWDRVLSDPEASRGRAGPLRCVLASDSAGPRGYALYAGTQQWEDDTFLPSSTLAVRELVAADAAASAALWGDLLSRDLTTSFRADLRPADDPLLYQLADPRRTRPTISDGLWVRLVDVAAALSARRYSAPVSVVIAVRDRELPKNEGHWRLTTAVADEADAGGLAAVCSRTDDAADLEVDVASLGAAYLGGTRLGTLAGAGLVTELRPGAVRSL
ncbi:MAG TPA: GNAT family N-acetyltransferase, partial [Streptosporangiaceae bacterium]|nr:GNAT family N-acetyltransferase [Streptosporangiaceae bacterium]